MVICKWKNLDILEHLALSILFRYCIQIPSFLIALNRKRWRWCIMERNLLFRPLSCLDLCTALWKVVCHKRYIICFVLFRTTYMLPAWSTSLLLRPPWTMIGRHWLQHVKILCLRWCYGVFACGVVSQVVEAILWFHDFWIVSVLHVDILYRDGSSPHLGREGILLEFTLLVILDDIMILLSNI